MHTENNVLLLSQLHVCWIKLSKDPALFSQLHKTADYKKITTAEVVTFWETFSLTLKKAGSSSTSSTDSVTTTDVGPTVTGKRTSDVSGTFESRKKCRKRKCTEKKEPVSTVIMEHSDRLKRIRRWADLLELIMEKTAPLEGDDDAGDSKSDRTQFERLVSYYLYTHILVYYMSCKSVANIIFKSYYMM
jgi:hypothetical protein